MSTLKISAAPGNTKFSKPGTSWQDMFGIVASVGCAIHCAAMPFVIAYLPALGLSFLADEAFHKWMALICFLIAIAAFLPGLRKHGSWLPVGVGSVGLVLITFAAFGLAGECCPACEEKSAESSSLTTGISTECQDCEHCSGSCSDQEQSTESTLANDQVLPIQDPGLLSKLAPWITPFGGLLLVSAHLLNRRYGCLCGCCVPGDAELSA